MVLVYCLPANILAQADSKSADSTKVKNSIAKIRALHSKFGTGKIILKDRGSIKNVLIQEIHPYWIVYKKNESLHDLMMEKIEKIEIGKEYHRTIYFDKNNKPIIY